MRTLSVIYLDRILISAGAFPSVRKKTRTNLRIFFSDNVKVPLIIFHTDIVLSFGTSALIAAYCASCVAAQYYGLKKCSKLSTLVSGLPEADYSVGPCLAHHTFVIGGVLVAGTLMGIGVPLSAGIDLKCADVVTFTVYNVCAFTYGYMLTR